MEKKWYVIRFEGLPWDYSNLMDNLVGAKGFQGVNICENGFTNFLYDSEDNRNKIWNKVTNRAKAYCEELKLYKEPRIALIDEDNIEGIKTKHRLS